MSARLAPTLCRSLIVPDAASVGSKFIGRHLNRILKGQLCMCKKGNKYIIIMSKGFDQWYVCMTMDTSLCYTIYLNYYFYLKKCCCSLGSRFGHALCLPAFKAALIITGVTWRGIITTWRGVTAVECCTLSAKSKDSYEPTWKLHEWNWCWWATKHLMHHYILNVC